MKIIMLTNFAVIAGLWGCRHVQPDAAGSREVAPAKAVVAPLVGDENARPAGLRDEREVAPVEPQSLDRDGDGLSNLLEELLGTKPDNADSDGDRFPDGWEYLYRPVFDPLVRSDRDDTPTGIHGDADQDGLSNFKELMLGTNPLSADTDGDGYSDAREVAVGSYPTVATDHP